ncbi:MAG: hypothetical protein Edafosvirus5_41 [Edafosvirus sp.]|uniref:inosine/xanthosine triphosphatase n=1 Tax=Edafosvirus sp. TaxID=2487765 RepID=A0A3G4ZX02_9VIRU|nr:MAG: hypothetical protein Edafosvirus5_41 [Edafosvirus sp.]
MSKIIAVGSGTGLKPSCVADVFPGYKIIAIPVQSGVNEQPIGCDETKKGAINRAEKALEKEPNAVFSFGIENGLVNDKDNGWIDVACIICICPNQQIIEKWSDSVNVPITWMKHVASTDVTYVRQVKDKIPELKDVDLHDPHYYLTDKKKSRKMFLVETLELIKKEYLTDK